MAQLREMLEDLRAEIGHSLNVAHGQNTRETLIYYIKRTQKELYTSYDWPHLLVDHTVPIVANTRYYDFPSEIEYEFINQIWCRFGNEFMPMTYGIDPADYSLYPPGSNARGWPLLKWRHYQPTKQMEVWPTPSQAGEILVRGQAVLVPMVNDGDQSILDGTAIVLYAAAEMLARQKDEDAALKLQKAQTYLNNLRKQMGANKRRPIAIGASGDVSGRRPYPRAGIDYIPSGYHS